MTPKDKWILDAIASGVYRVDPNGRVIRVRKSKQAKYAEKEVKPFMHPKTGYMQLTMSWRNQQKCVLLHRVVALVHIPNPFNLPDVNHDDGDKTNCAKDNLEWMTKGDNEKHAYRTGLKTRKGEANSQSKLTEDMVRAIRTSTETCADLAAKFSISSRTVRDIQSERTWKEVT